jgi:hypothetical protein
MKPPLNFNNRTDITLSNPAPLSNRDFFNIIEGFQDESGLPLNGLLALPTVSHNLS